MECDYGCGKEAKYQIKNGKWCCSKSSNSCESNKRKNSIGVAKAHADGRIPGFRDLMDMGYDLSWSRGLTRDSHPSIKKQMESYRKSFDSGMIQGPFTGRKHSDETKQLMSSKSSETNNGFVKTKYYEIYCLYLDAYVKVQGSYELAYAQYLNDNSILWKRGGKPLKYKLTDDGYYHTYFPDFYLIDSDEYIEIKGRWWTSKDGRLDDKRKMRQVFKYNKDKKIKILTYKILKRMKILT